MTLVTENVNYTGPCSFEYAIKQGTKKIAGESSTTGTCSAPPGTGYVTTWVVNLPATVTPGQAVVVGAVVAGSNTYSIFHRF